MLAVVKKPRTEKTLFSVKGEIPHKVTDYLKKEFGSDFEIPEGDEEVVNIFDTAWYKDIRSVTSSGDVLKIYRENIGLTREELGREIGEFSAQEIADMEDGKSVISRGLAEKLSHFFEVPASRFICKQPQFPSAPQSAHTDGQKTVGKKIASTTIPQ